MKKKFFMVLALCLIAMTAVFANGQAESSAEVNYPTKEITLIIPWNPGGTNDLAGRAMQPVFKSMYDVNLVIKNVPGGGSAVGILEATNAKNDGYTLGLATSSYLALLAQERVASTLDASTNMMSVMEEPIVLVVKNNGKYSDAASLLADLKANPGKVSCGVPGTNNVNQIYATLLQEQVGAEFNFMPFDGGSRVVAELIGGHVDCGVLKPSETISQVRGGELKIVGVFNKDGISILPDVPTFESLGYDVFRLGNVQQTAYLMGPKGIDPKVEAKIIEMFTNVINSEEYKEFAASVGIQLNVQSGEDFDNYITDIYKGLEKASQEIFTK